MSIDLEEMGRGSRYQDLGFVAYLMMLKRAPGLLPPFLLGYQSLPIALDPWRLHQTAGLISLAYASFADTDRRLAVGVRLMQEADRHLGWTALRPAAE